MSYTNTYVFTNPCTNLLLDKVKALKNLWLVGDEFLRQMFTTIAAVRAQARIENKDQPYVYRYFNVEALQKKRLLQQSEYTSTHSKCYS